MKTIITSSGGGGGASSMDNLKLHFYHIDTNIEMLTNVIYCINHFTCQIVQ